MRKRKSLAFKKEKPKMTKNLFFSTLAFAAAITSCAPAVTALPRREVITAPTISEPIRRTERACRVDPRNWLRKGERIRGTLCRDGRIFALTGESLLMGREANRGFFFSDITLESSHSRTDMRDILKTGLVDWTASHDTAYFLTKDRMLTPIPVGELGEQMNSYEMPVEYANAKMEFHRDFLLIAGSGKLMAVSFDPHIDTREIPFTLSAKNADFFQNEGKLFFGNERERIEIVFESSRLSDIRVR
jgi:hypothetical protein